MQNSSDGMILIRKAVKAQGKSKHGGKVMQQGESVGSPSCWGETGRRVPLYKEADEREGRRGKITLRGQVKFIKRRGVRKRSIKKNVKSCGLY